MYVIHLYVYQIVCLLVLPKSPFQRIIEISVLDFLQNALDLLQGRSDIYSTFIVEQSLNCFHQLLHKIWKSHENKISIARKLKANKIVFILSMIHQYKSISLYVNLWHFSMIGYSHLSCLWSYRSDQPPHPWHSSSESLLSPPEVPPAVSLSSTDIKSRQTIRTITQPIFFF